MLTQQQKKNGSNWKGLYAHSVKKEAEEEPSHICEAHWHEQYRGDISSSMFVMRASVRQTNYRVDMVRIGKVFTHTL
jgi:hypothetical protein